MGIGPSTSYRSTGSLSLSDVDAFGAGIHLDRSFILHRERQDAS
jgi:hypothetical protein